VLRAPGGLPARVCLEKMPGSSRGVRARSGTVEVRERSARWASGEGVSRKDAGKQPWCPRPIRHGGGARAQYAPPSADNAVRSRCGAAAASAGLIGMPSDPEPPDATAERLDQQAQRDKEHRGGHCVGQDVGGRNGQHDAHDRGDHLGPSAGRLRTAQPRQHPAAGHERIPGQTHREHPPTGLTCDVHAQDHDQERVDLHVEARPERRGGVGTPSDLAVDTVEHQRHRRERHEDRRRRLAPKGVHRERHDPRSEDPASQGHAVPEARTPRARVTRSAGRSPTWR